MTEPQEKQSERGEPEQTAILWRQLRNDPSNIELRNQIIEHYTDFSERLTRWFLRNKRNPSNLAEEYRGSACLGLLHASKLYDVESGNKFTTYAKHWILKELQEANDGSEVGEVRLNEQRAQNSHAIGYRANDCELSTWTDSTEEELDDLINKLKPISPKSLDNQFGTDTDYNDSQAPADKKTLSPIDQVANKDLSETSLDEVPKEHREDFWGYFTGELTAEEIATKRRVKVKAGTVRKQHSDWCKKIRENNPELVAEYERGSIDRAKT